MKAKVLSFQHKETGVYFALTLSIEEDQDEFDQLRVSIQAPPIQHQQSPEHNRSAKERCNRQGKPNS